MAFTVEDYNDLVRLLSERPEWRMELRQLLVADDMWEIRRVLRDLAEAQQRSEERLGRLEATVAALVEAQQRTEDQIRELVAAQRRTEERVNALVDGQQRLESRVDRMSGDLSQVKGRTLEIQWARKAHGYCGRLIRRAEVVPIQRVEDALLRSLTPEEMDDVMLLDTLVRGRLPRADSPEVFLAVEVSAVVDRNDVERSARRSALLRRAGLRAIPVAAGDSLTRGAEEAASSGAVVIMEDGRYRFWDEAVARWAPAP